MIAVIDYGAGNLGSVVNALSRLAIDHVVSADARTLLGADGIIFPGVGATADTMATLRDRGLVDVIAAAATSEIPFLGICVGQQVLFSRSHEGATHDCLDVFRGDVRRFAETSIVPHMGWNGVHRRYAHPLFAGIPADAEFYFVHSYYVEPVDGDLILGETDYGVTFASAIARGALVATQFHPEKSGHWGLKLLENFGAIVNEDTARRSIARLSHGPSAP